MNYSTKQKEALRTIAKIEVFIEEIIECTHFHTNEGLCISAADITDKISKSLPQIKTQIKQNNIDQANLYHILDKLRGVFTKLYTTS